MIAALTPARRQGASPHQETEVWAAPPTAGTVRDLDCDHASGRDGSGLRGATGEQVTIGCLANPIRLMVGPTRLTPGAQHRSPPFRLDQIPPGGTE